MLKMRTNPPSYDLLVVLRATLAKLESRRKPLTSRGQILRDALALRIHSIEEYLRIDSPNSTRSVCSETAEHLRQQTGTTFRA